MSNRGQYNQSTPILTMISTYISFLLLILIGHIEDLIKQIFKLLKNILLYLKENILIFNKIKKKHSKNYINIPITTDFETFFIRRIFFRVKTCWDRIITGVPGNYIKLIIRPENYINYKKLIKNDSLNIEIYKELELDNILKYNSNFDTKGALNLYYEYKFRLKKNINYLIWDSNEEIKKEENSFLKLNSLKNIDEQNKNILNQLKYILKSNINGISPIKEIIKKENILEKCRISKEKNLMTKTVLNIGSYNYLGFGSNDKNKIKSALKTLKKYPIIISAPEIQTGSLKPIIKLERYISKFIGTEDTLIFSMGFGTNSMTLPILLNSDTLVLSDEFNHRSLIFGTQLSRATIKTFSHNDMNDLENKLRYYISQGQNKTHRDWKKVFVLVEGVYSMEGTIVPLDKLVELKSIYKFYIFIDEAHSIGVIGKRGKGISRLFNKNLKDKIDIYMGTFSKSFGGMGGYISGKKELIDFLRISCDSNLYGEQMPPLIASHISFIIKEISKKGFKLRKKLQSNTKYMRNALKKRRICNLW